MQEPGSGPDLSCNAPLLLQLTYIGGYSLTDPEGMEGWVDFGAQ